jgi:hypothetical protein
MAKLEITYSKNPTGLVGERPRKLSRGEEIEFTCNDPGELEIEFVGESPLEGGVKKMKKGDKRKLGQKAGLFKFDCLLTQNGKTRRLGSNGAEVSGGELEIGPP